MQKANPHISAICPNDFGLKAAFRDKGGAVTFKPIVGWVSVTNYVESGRLPFVAVVLNDHGFPAMVAPSNFPDFVGHFANGVSADKARRIIEQQGVRIPIRDPGRPLE